MSNPLLDDQAAIPALDKIRPEHFEPAIDKALAEAQDRLDALAAADDFPTFENTVLPLENLFHDITRIHYVMELYDHSVSTDEQVAASEVVSGKSTNFSNTVFQDQAVAARFMSVYEAKDTLDLDAQDKHLLESLYKNFQTSGAFLAAEGQQRIQEIDAELVKLTSKYGDNLKKSAGQQAILITDPVMLDGVPENMVSAFASAAKEKGQEGWLFTPERLLVDALLQVARNRDFCEQIHNALNRMGTQEPYDNEPVIRDIHRLRDERAGLLGYPNHAEFALKGTMAGDLASAEAIMDEVEAQAVKIYEEQFASIADYAAAHGGPEELEAWDLAFWANEYKNDVYSFDAAAFDKYLELDSALEGYFDTVGRLFNVEFRESTDIPPYHPDVKCYEVIDKATGKQIGYELTDFYQRGETKVFGAWMQDIQNKCSEKGIDKPYIGIINANYPKPEAGKPTFLSVDDLETLYHEGGHGMHGLLGTKTRYRSMQGPAASPDFVEIHSMTVEGFSGVKENLLRVLRHHETGAPVPEELVDRMLESRNFFKAKEVLKMIQNARWDFAFHKTSHADYKDTASVQEENRLNTPHAEQVRPYPLTRFSHLYSSPFGGYDAGYYGYLWSQIHAEDNVDYLAQHGLFDPALTTRLTEFYSHGSSIEYNELYEGFRGQKASTSALLSSLGAKPDEGNAAPGKHEAPGPII